jgi:hypothetical protein
MMLADLWTWLENLPLAGYIGESWWFPFLESIHVVGITMVFGSLLMVDLRLLGVAARSYTVSRMSKELVPWTWGAFVIAVITGIGLFMARASHYAENPAFRFKALFLLFAGINMAVFHFGIYRRVSTWDATSPPSAAKLAGALSLFLWAGVMLAGRWVGHLS